MDIAVYAICYNEEYMLPFFLQHYMSFASEIIIYDNHSSDSSVHIMNESDVTVNYFESDNSIRDDIMLNIKNQFWKKSRGWHDWVIIADIDEFIYHPNLKNFFLKNQNKTLLIPTGYNMFAEEMPRIENGPIYAQAQFGTANPKFFNKPCIFRPNEIKEINFETGGHAANPVGNVVSHSDPELKLLHYDYLTIDYRLRKCKERGQRLSEFNQEKKWGLQYMQTAEEAEADYYERKQRSERVVWTNGISNPMISPSLKGGQNGLHALSDKSRSDVGLRF